MTFKSKRHAIILISPPSHHLHWSKTLIYHLFLPSVSSISTNILEIFRLEEGKVLKNKNKQQKIPLIFLNEFMCTVYHLSRYFCLFSFYKFYQNMFFYFNISFFFLIIIYEHIFSLLFHYFTIYYFCVLFVEIRCYVTQFRDGFSFIKTNVKHSLHSKRLPFTMCAYFDTSPFFAFLVVTKL